MTFVQGIEAIDLWVKSGTPDVPDDRKFHVVHHGSVVASFRREAQAIARYREMVKEIGYRPDPQTPAENPDAIAHAIADHQMDSYEEFWASSHGHRRRGGWGR